MAASIRQAGMRVGVALAPDTPVSVIMPVLAAAGVDMVSEVAIFSSAPAGLVPLHVACII